MQRGMPSNCKALVSKALVSSSVCLGRFASLFGTVPPSRFTLPFGESASSFVAVVRGERTKLHCEAVGICEQLELSHQHVTAQ